MSRLIPVANIQRHPDADLFPHDEEHVQRLAEDVKARGITTPLHVYPLGTDRYLLLAGHDRLEAAKRAGFTEVPADMRSMLSSEEERFEYFVKDNTLRKDVDKRAVAKAVARKYPDAPTTRIASVAGVSQATAYRAREELVQAGVIQVNNEATVTDSLGREQPARKPSAPKVVDIADRRRPEPAPSKVDQLRAMREQRAAEAERHAPAPEAPEEPAGPDVSTLVGHARREFRESSTGRMHAYVRALPTPPDFTDADIAGITWDPASRDILAMHRDLIDRLLNKEADRASA